MPKVVVNACCGGFGLSKEASELYEKYSGKDANKLFNSIAARADLDLVRVVEELGPGVNAPYSCLCVLEIPDDVKWRIMDYDGLEWVAEQHREWRPTRSVSGSIRW
jgi:hypothetical protein